MILKKLQEALSEVDDQRTALDDVERQLRSMISKLSGTPYGVSQTVTRVVGHTTTTSRRGERDRIDDILDILGEHGKPMHITDIASSLSQKKGKTIDRTQVEPGLNRHITTAKTKRIEKFGPSIFGLPEWKSRPTPLANAS